TGTRGASATSTTDRTACHGATAGQHPWGRHRDGGHAGAGSTLAQPARPQGRRTLRRAHRLSCPFSRVTNAESHPGRFPPGCLFACWHARWRAGTERRLIMLWYAGWLPQDHGASRACLYLTTEVVFQAGVEGCPDLSRPPPCMPDDDPVVWLAGGTMLRDHLLGLRQSAVTRVTVAHGRSCHLVTPL